MGGTALSVGDALGRPATVKCRIGVDDEDSYEGTYVRMKFEMICHFHLFFTPRLR